MTDKKILLTDETVDAVGGDDEYDLFMRRMNYKTRSADCFTKYNHDCPVCHNSVVKMKGCSGWWACDNCQIRFIENS